MTSFRRLSALGALALFAAMIAASDAPAQCPPPFALTNDVSSASTPGQTFALTTTAARWGVVAVRPDTPIDWALEGFDATDAFPTCYSGSLGTANSGAGVDFFAIDSRFRAPEADYVRAFVPSMQIGTARVEFEQYDFAVRANFPWDHIIVGSNDVVTVREVEMFAGFSHRIEFVTSAGATGLKMYVFAPVTSGNGFVPRGGRVYEQALTAGSGDIVNFTPTATGYHAIVVTNELASSGDFWLAVSRCPHSSVGMFDNTPYFSNLRYEWPYFIPTTKTWNAVAVRGETGYSYNLDVAADLRDASGLLNLSCTDTVVASQYSGLGTRLIVGDFRSIPLRTFTGWLGQEGAPNSNSNGYFEWEDGADVLAVNAVPTIVSPPAHNVIDAYSVNLVKDGNYIFNITPDGGATNTYTAHLYRNPSPGTAYWASRPDAVMTTTGTSGYTAPETGLFGLVVVNDNPNGTGGYTVSVSSNLIGVDPFAAVTGACRIRTISPNPTFASARVEFSLTRAGRVALRVSDVAGRVLAEIDAGAHEPGDGAVQWDGHAANGLRPPAGVYFASLVLDGVPLDRAKMIVLR